MSWVAFADHGAQKRTGLDVGWREGCIVGRVDGCPVGVVGLLLGWPDGDVCVWCVVAG